MGETRARYTPEEIEHLLRDEPPPRTFEQPYGACCGGCNTYPDRWPHDHWNCRRANLSIELRSPACYLWQPRPHGHVLEERNPLDHNSHVHAYRNKDVKLRVVKPAAFVEEIGRVYFVDCGEYTKIGYTGSDVSSRINGLMCGNPLPLVHWATLRGPLKLERELHRHWTAHRFGREWFRFSAEVREAVCEDIRQRGGRIFKKPREYRHG